MKHICFFLVLSFLCVHAISQDLIITNKSDSIHCNITKVKADFVYFTFKHTDEYRSTLLHISEIKEYKYNYSPDLKFNCTRLTGYDNFQHFRLALHGGYSYQVAKVGDSVPYYLRNYVRKLKSGFHFSGDMCYYYSENFGFGVSSCLFKSSITIYDVQVLAPGGGVGISELNDNLSISYIGPVFSSRILNQSKQNAFLMKLSMGYMNYVNRRVIIDACKITGNTLGLSFELGYDFGLSENMSLGLQTTFTAGVLTQYTREAGSTREIIKLESGQHESLSRIDFSIGLRFHK